jgi:hypothetical protein
MSVQPGSSVDQTPTKLQVPESLKQQLLAFRKRVWTIKFVEAIAIIACGFGLAFLSVYLVDRWGGMPAPMRAAMLAAALALTALLPWFVYRWVLRLLALEPLARLLGQRLPAVGDQLLGVIELSKNGSEQARSPALCQAAMRQVAEDAAKRDFSQATPRCRHRLWASLATITAIIVTSVALIYPAASANALARLFMPWKEIPRYTFTRIESLPAKWIVAHGEPVSLRIKLQDDSRWQPTMGQLSIANQPPITAELKDGQYGFVLPPQIVDQPLELRVGDVIERVTMVPTLRPELASVTAKVKLPEYLGKPALQQVDSRAGTVSMVRGSEAVFTATANRELAEGEINRKPRKPEGATLASDAVGVEAESSLEFKWKDNLGLEGREPFALSVNAVDDEAPTLICDGLPRQAVVLDSEALKFSLRANDDFGIRRVGMEWRGFVPGAAEKTAKGEKPLSAGGPDADNLEVVGTFSAKSLNIEPQPIELFVWAEDYLPGRPRVYSPPHILYVLTPDQHAIWMTEQLSKWHRQALDVRDSERQLYEKNKELRALSADELDQDANRRQVERQAAAERANGNRLDRLGEIGDELVRAAARNPEIGVGHLERWAEMLQVLNDLSENRMPSVADLLKETAAGKPQVASTSPKAAPMAGQMRDAKPGAAAEQKPNAAKLPDVPKLVDGESSMNSPDEEKATPGAPKKPSSGSLRLPTTTVMGKAKAGEEPPPPQAQQDSLQQAVEEQEELLAEFDKLADELNNVLANLEGSTLVKRLKAASREQNVVAGKLTEQLQPAFGVSKARLKEPVREMLTGLQSTEQKSSQTISFIMDDLAAYFERRRFAQFKMVLDEMKSVDVLGGLRKLAEELPTEQGLSIAQCEYWSDAMDRWAENLVDPACSGTCPGGKSPDSLPPSIVLEVLQILEAEINLRDETRVAEQAIAAVEAEKHAEDAKALSKTQAELSERVLKVIDRIRELPDSQANFGKELSLLAAVDTVMTEAALILNKPETGAPAIAAETEAIELLLRSKRINPKGGGGGGSSPGGGGYGNTTDSALALLGKGTNQKEVREDRGITQSTGETGAVLPEEFRRGLDQYFNRIGEPQR